MGFFMILLCSIWRKIVFVFLVLSIVFFSLLIFFIFWIFCSVIIGCMIYWKLFLFVILVLM